MDCLVVLAWLLLVSGLALGLRALGFDPHWSASDEVTADLVTFAAVLVPVGIYLVATETGRLQATFGKRRVGLRVVREDGSRASTARLVLRATIKLSPWFLAHLGLSRLYLHLGTPLSGCFCLTLVYVIVAVSIGLALVHPQRRALHDWLAGTRVVAD